MALQGYYTLYENTTCPVAYPTFTFEADTCHDITFTATLPTESPDKPDFDNSQASVNIGMYQNPFHFQHHHDTTINISSTYKTKAIKYVPTRSTPDSIGYDLRSAVSTSIPPNSRKPISLGFTIAIPPGLYGRIAPRSGLY